MTTGLVLGMALAMAIPAGAGPAPKTDVCHLDDEGVHRLITISENALQSHLDHGDARPGDAVPGMPGSQFDGTCAAEDIPATKIVTGSYSNPLRGTTLTTGFTVFQEWDGSHSGVGTYVYGSNTFAFDVTDACVDPVAKSVTARGTVTSASGVSGDHAFLTIVDTGGSFSARAGIRATEAEIDPFYADQCDGTPVLPASGPTGSLVFH